MSELDGINRHLEELRKRLLRIVLVIGIITAFILTFHAEPIQVEQITLYYPSPEPLNNIAAQITNHMKLNLVPEDVQLIQTAPGQAFFAQVYIAALVGIVIGMPIIIRELVGFIKPALKENEINVSRNITIPALGLFIAGCVFSYNFVIPYILEFFIQIWRICRASNFSEHNGFCYFCFTIFIGVWIFISASTCNVCNICIRNGRFRLLEKEYQVCDCDNCNLWCSNYTRWERCNNVVYCSSNDCSLRSRHDNY